MFTFEKQDKNPLFHIDDKPVYTIFKKDDSLRIPPFVTLESTSTATSLENVTH